MRWEISIEYNVDSQSTEQVYVKHRKDGADWNEYRQQRLNLLELIDTRFETVRNLVLGSRAELSVPLFVCCHVSQ